MKNFKILFLHGLEGVPEGTKPTYLKKLGYRVIAPVLPKDNWELSLKRAHVCYESFRPHIVVGSSRGGALAAAMHVPIPKILIAPAWKKFDVVPRVDEHTVILHYPGDDKVDYSDSVYLKDYLDCKLITCGESHRMSDDSALNTLCSEVERLAAERGNR